MPTGQAFQEAVQNPKLNFADPELQQGQPVVNELGLPKPISGNFASVFTLDCPGGKRYAVKCFFNHYDDLHERYDAIHRYLEAVDYPWEVHFAYQSSGIRVAGLWQPVVKMEWFEGVRLDRYVQQHLGQPKLILEVANKFVSAVRALNESGAAHGDLQHGNILVSKNGDLRLVDYDGMYVPGLTGRKSHELGHPNYQHPCRTENDFGPYLDNFSAWVIYLSLLAVAVDPTVWIRVQGGDDALLFKRQDFGGGIFSAGFAAVESSGSDSLRELATQLRGMVDLEVVDVPRLTPMDIDVPDVPLQASFSTSTPLGIGPQLGTPDWIGTVTPATDEGEPGGLDWMLAHLDEAALVVPTSRVGWSRAIVVAFVCAIAAAFIGVAYGLAPVAAISVSTAAFALAAAMLWSVYGRSPDVQEKRRLRDDIAAKRKRVQASASVVHKLAKQRAKNDEKESKKRAELQRRQQKMLQAEQQALGRVEQQMLASLRELAEKRSGLAADEQRERAAALTQLQSSFVQSRLAQFPIEDAAIRGIGPNLTITLSVYGFRTAADLASYTYGMDNVLLVHSSGRAVHVDGIGEQRALSLTMWRNDLERRVRASAPQSLSDAQTLQIQRKYADRLGEIGIEEDHARRVAQREADPIRATSQAEQGKLMIEFRDASSAAASARADLDRQLSDARREHNAQQWALASKERDARAYRDVTFRRFITATFGGNS